MQREDRQPQNIVNFLMRLHINKNLSNHFHVAFHSDVVTRAN